MKISIRLFVGWSYESIGSFRMTRKEYDSVYVCCYVYIVAIACKFIRAFNATRLNGI